MFRIPWLSFFCLLLLVSACGREETPQERHARGLLQQAHAALRSGNDPVARELLHDALTLTSQNGTTAAEPFLLLGEIYSRTAQFDSAVVVFKKAQELYSFAGYKDGVRAVVLARAQTHRVRGEYRKALDVLQEQIRLGEALGEKHGLANLKWAAVPLCRILDEREQEQRLLTQLAELYDETGDRSMQARVRREFGLSSLHRGGYDEALRNFANALAFAEQAQDSLLVIDLYLQRARAYAAMGKINESFAEFTNGLRRTDLTRGSEALREEMMMRVGNIYLRKHNPESARIYFARTLSSATAAKKPLLEGYALLQLGHCAGSSQEAWERYRAGAELLDSCAIPWARAYAMACLGYAALRQNRVNEALRYFQIGAEHEYASASSREMDDVFTDSEDAFYQSYGLPPAEALTDMLFQLQKHEEGFAQYETRKRVMLLETYNAVQPRSSSEELNAGIRMYAEARGDYRGAIRRLAETCADLGCSSVRARRIREVVRHTSGRLLELGDSLASAHPRMSVLFSRQPPTLRAVQNHILAGTAFADYITTPRTLYIFLATKSSIQTTLSPIGKGALSELMHEYVRLLSESAGEREVRGLHAARLQQLSARLYGIFLRPAERALPGVQRLYVALPLDMPLVPLHALRAEGQRSAYAIQRFAFRYYPDAECLTFERKQLPFTPHVIGFGNPGATSADVEYEVRDARVAFREARLFFSRDATLERLQKERAELLHAAVDIRFRIAGVQGSRVMLKDASGYAGAHAVPLGEVFGFVPFNTILLSPVHHSGAHPAIARMFLMNGTSSLVMNSYPLPRKTKKRFNELFYAELVHDVAVDAAYRRALLYMLRDVQQNDAWLWGSYLLW